MAIVNSKILGAALTNEARKRGRPRTKKNAEEQALLAKWGEYLGGPETIVEQAELLSKIKDPKAVVEAWLSSEEGFASEYLAVRDTETGLEKSIDLEIYQIDLLRNNSMYAFYKKARRIGLSYATAIKALVRAHLMDSNDTYFVSKNQEEAKEKIKYALELWTMMPPDIKKNLASRGIRAQLEFESKSGIGVSRLISHPQTEPRGVQGDIYLDEFSSYLRQEDIYTAAQNSLTREGRIWILSTPRNKGDIFYKIDQGLIGKQVFEQNKFALPWWKSKQMVKEGFYKEAQTSCPELDTKTRVYRYGSPKLIATYEGNISEGLFRVEYECEYIDDANSFYPDSILSPCLFAVKDKEYDKTLNKDGLMNPYEEMENKLLAANINPLFTQNIQELVHACEHGIVGSRLVMGIDPGYTDGCSIVILEEFKDFAILRYQVKYLSLGYAKREEKIVEIGKRLPIRRIAIDEKDGEGRALISRLKSIPYFGEYKIAAIPASPGLNADMAIDLKRRLEAKMIALPHEEAIIKDLKKVSLGLTKSGEATIEARRDKDGHADNYFALIYAVHLLSPIAANQSMATPDYESAGVPKRTLLSGPFTPTPSDPERAAILKKLEAERNQQFKQKYNNSKIREFNSIRIPGVIDFGKLPKP